MNGLDFRRELARAGIATPIIFLTGDIDHGEGHQVHAAGVAGVATVLASGDEHALRPGSIRQK
jgi:DNA-binding NarL/FixJ family response regulator